MDGRDGHPVQVAALPVRDAIRPGASTCAASSAGRTSGLYLAQVPRALTTFRGILKVSSAATLVGLQVPSGTRMLELKPYALSGVATDTTVTPRLSNDATNRIGGDLKYGVTQNLTRRRHGQHRLRAGRSR